jgi:hypothetical protein
MAMAAASRSLGSGALNPSSRRATLSPLRLAAAPAAPVAHLDVAVAAEAGERAGGFELGMQGQKAAQSGPHDHIAVVGQAGNARRIEVFSLVRGAHQPRQHFG